MNARLLPLALAASLSWTTFAPAQETGEPVDLELVLAVDVSWSMDYEEQILQRAGYVAAFRHPEVVRAIESGLTGRIAVTYVEWAGADLQAVVVPWTLIDGPAAASAFADRLDVPPSGSRRRTSISGALLYGAALFKDNGYAGERRVIDVSGDGANNQGVPATAARDAVVTEGIVINGLPILLKEADTFYSIDNLDLYYEDCVIGGPGAFLVTVDDLDEFTRAIRRKLVLEIAGGGSGPRLIPAQFSPRPEPRVDCLIGEKLWQMRMRTFGDP